MSCIRNCAESWTITEAVRQSSNSSLQLLQCTFFNCNINPFHVIDGACKWNSGKLQIVCETNLSAHGAQCSVTLRIVSPLWKVFLCCFFNTKTLHLAYFSNDIFVYKPQNDIWNLGWVCNSYADSTIDTLCFIRAWKQEHIYLHLLWPSMDMPMHN